MKKLIVLLFVALTAVSCDVAKSVAGAYSLTQCEYKYNSISGLTLAGVNLQNATSLSSLNPLTAAKLLAAVNSNSLPLQFTLNLNVKNPNAATAMLSGLQYILEIDNVEMTTGSLNTPLSIATGQTATLPINIGFDLKKVLSGQSGDAVKNMAYNFAGIGDKASNVTIRLKPSFNVGGQTISSPSFIPVTFNYGKGYK